MSYDSDDKRSDYAKWAEEMSYEDEKELKRQKKLEEKEKKKAEKLAKKESKKETLKEKNNSSDPAVNLDKTSSDDIKTDGLGDSEESLKGAFNGSIDGKPALEPVGNAADVNTSDKQDVEAGEDEEYNPDYKKDKKKKSEDVNMVKELLSLIIYIGIIIIICYIIVTYVGQRTTVHGHSMETTLSDGDNLWIDKLSYRFSDPKRFDIIVFPYQGQDVYYIKRVIGLPGETVQITPEGNIMINDEVLAESYGREIIRESGIASEPITLGPDEFFVLGDNRNDSRDSRWADVGNINKKDIIGKATLRLSPFKKFGKVN